MNLLERIQQWRSNAAKRKKEAEQQRERDLEWRSLPRYSFQQHLVDLEELHRRGMLCYRLPYVGADKNYRRFGDVPSMEDLDRAEYERQRRAAPKTIVYMREAPMHETEFYIDNGVKRLTSGLELMDLGHWNFVSWRLTFNLTRFSFPTRFIEAPRDYAVELKNIEVFDPRSHSFWSEEVSIYDLAPGDMEFIRRIRQLVISAPLQKPPIKSSAPVSPDAA